jgi:hypothetical protein
MADDIQKLKKTQGWEIRLNDLIMKYYDLAFERGENCCFLFISDAYEAICEQSPISEWRGQFKDKKKALALYKKHAKTKSFEKTFQWLIPVSSYKLAQRGDMGMEIVVEKDEETGKEIIKENLGIVAMNGRDFLTRCEDRDGLVRMKLNENVKLWRAE